MSQVPKDVAGFSDANGRYVKEGDEVEYRVGARRGILEFCGHDGAAWVHFFDTDRSEDVNWIHLCGVPEEFKTKPMTINLTTRQVISREIHKLRYALMRREQDAHALQFDLELAKKDIANYKRQVAELEASLTKAGLTVLTEEEVAFALAGLFTPNKKAET